MKKSMLTLAASFLFFNLLLAHNGDPKNEAEAVTTKEVSVSLKDVFLSDYEGVAMFIDFEPVSDEITSFKMVRSGAVVMEDDVSDLPNNAIYEINLEVLQSGIYTLELHTAQGIKIQKEMVIE